VEKRRYALRLAYDGRAFRGFQRQPGTVTVQECLEEALAHIGIRAPLNVAARTDAGVHALGQVVTFAVREAWQPAELRAAVNAWTPPALLCLEAACVRPSVHARASALSRTYVYLVGAPAPPELTGYSWSLPDRRAFPEMDAPRLDVARARDALLRIVGEHDFGGFARPGAQTARREFDPGATVRRVLRAELLAAAEAPLTAFVLEGSGFLRAMVRNIVGATVSAAVGACEPARISEILAAPHRRYRGVRAPGWGLTLARVHYPEPFFSW
jgi:tRNA pseudouridine38-40 synthase